MLLLLLRLPTLTPRRYHSKGTGANTEYCPSRRSANGYQTRNGTHFVLTVAPGVPKLGSNNVTWFVDGAFNRQKTDVGSGEGDRQLGDLWALWR